MTNPTRTRRRFTAQQKAEAVELCLQELQRAGVIENAACHESMEAERPGVACTNRCATTTFAMARTVGFIP